MGGQVLVLINFKFVWLFKLCMVQTFCLNKFKRCMDVTDIGMRKVMMQSKKVSFTCSECEFAQLLCVLLNDNVDDSGLKNLSEIAEFTSKAFSLFAAYSFDFVDSSKSSGQVAVTHMNVKGRVCNSNWDDDDARVMCKTKGHLDGIAFHYSQYNYVSFSSRGPFWVSSVNCTGNETRLQDCPFSDRLHLGNCSKADLAGAVCFNDSGEDTDF